jgi:hypothetical protein
MKPTRLFCNIAIPPETIKIFVAKSQGIMINMKQHKSEITACQELKRRRNHRVQKDSILYGFF